MLWIPVVSLCFASATKQCDRPAKLSLSFRKHYQYTVKTTQTITAAVKLYEARKWSCRKQAPGLRQSDSSPGSSAPQDHWPAWSCQLWYTISPRFSARPRSACTSRSGGWYQARKYGVSPNVCTPDGLKTLLRVSKRFRHSEKCFRPQRSSATGERLGAAET